MRLKVCVPQYWLELFDHPMVENEEDLENYLGQTLAHLHESRASDEELHLFFMCVIDQDKKHGNSMRLLNQEPIMKGEAQSIIVGAQLSMIRAIALRNHDECDENVPVIALACQNFNRYTNFKIPFVKFLLALGFNPNAVDSHGKTGLHYVLESSSLNEQTMDFIMHWMKFDFKDDSQDSSVPRIAELLEKYRGRTLLKERKQIIRYLNGEALVSDMMFVDERVISFKGVD